MLTFFTMLIGFLSSMGPEFLKKWQDSSDKRHEIVLLKLQMEASAKGYEYKMDEIGVEAYRDIVTSAHKEQADTLERASQWMIDLSASVRPMVTYLLLIAFIGFKFCAFFAAINPSLPWHEPMTFAQAMLSIWGGEETALFSGVIAFWFGDRAMAKKRST